MTRAKQDRNIMENTYEGILRKAEERAVMRGEKTKKHAEFEIEDNTRKQKGAFGIHYGL